MTDHTPSQRKIIQSFYRNREAIDTQRLQDLVGEIWLATSDPARDRLWARVRQILEKLPGADLELIERLCTDRDVETLALIAAERFGDEP